MKTNNPLNSQNILVFDGAMGSQLKERNLHGIPEDLNITHPDIISEIHQSYGMADIITTNTFGLNRIKYEGDYPLALLAKAAIANARTAGKRVFFDVGPTGKLMEPMGALSFDEAYDVFKEVAEISRDEADGYIVETFSDLYELKACILALKENSDLPVFATMTFDESMRTLSGSSVEIMVNTLQGLGVNALGINCSLGPDEMLPLIKKMVRIARIPVIVQPNRGLPQLVDGQTVYPLSLEEFDAAMEQIVNCGVSVIGGCCGTTPEFIKSISRFSGMPVQRAENRPVSAINSSSRIVLFDHVVVCGERLNPTGKKKIKQALIDKDYPLLAKEALEQEMAGAQVLDVNLGLPQIDEVAMMPEVIAYLQSLCDLPLQIDSSNPQAIELGCRYYNGIPLINSVNGEDKVLDSILPAAKKYGAYVVALTMDADGIPDSFEKRVKIAKHILKKGEEHGLGAERFFFDGLVVTASAQQDQIKETLKSVEWFSENGLKSTLGISNVSFGLPMRPLLNRTFLAMALQAGLTMPILNPLDASMMETLDAFNVLNGGDKNAAHYIGVYKDAVAGSATRLVKKEEKGTIKDLKEAVFHGFKEQAVDYTKDLLETSEPLSVVNEWLIPALDEVGQAYEQKKLFLPQLISSAEAAKASFELVAQARPKEESKGRKVILATVKGDVHDIGKNIVKVLLESYGYEVLDLGKDVDPDIVVQAALKENPFAIGLSALMTTTVPAMGETIQSLKEAGVDIPVFVGGAVLNPEIAKDIQADYYTKDGLEMVRILETL